jgi:hypothetical protein
VGCRRGGGVTVIGRCARTAATFWVFLTLGTTGFFSRVAIAFDFRAERLELLRATFFFAATVGRLGIGFFARASDLEVAALDLFRATDFEGEALFALGCFDLAFTAPRLADFEADLPAELLLVDRVKPLVTGVLIRRSK